MMNKTYSTTLEMTNTSVSTIAMGFNNTQTAIHSKVSPLSIFSALHVAVLTFFLGSIK